jgi:hypothetical protein
MKVFREYGTGFATYRDDGRVRCNVCKRIVEWGTERAHQMTVRGARQFFCVKCWDFWVRCAKHVEQKTTGERAAA